MIQFNRTSVFQGQTAERNIFRPTLGLALETRSGHSPNKLLGEPSDPEANPWGISNPYAEGESCSASGFHRSLAGIRTEQGPLRLAQRICSWERPARALVSYRAGPCSIFSRASDGRVPPAPLHQCETSRDARNQGLQLSLGPADCSCACLVPSLAPVQPSPTPGL